MKKLFISFLVLAVSGVFLFPGSGLAAVVRGSIEGTVLSAETNQPLAGAALELQRSYPRKPPVSFRTTSNEGGRFTALLPAGTYHYLIRKPGFGLLEGTAVVTAAKKVVLPPPLKREAQVSGRIMAAGGKPLAGIAVSFGKYAQGRTDSAGRFTVPALNEGWYELTLDHPSWVPERQVSFSLAAGERKEAGDVVVRKAGSSGRARGGREPPGGRRRGVTLQ
ncbi:MAG: carboxypeptidase-like regulatory domain-containing protein [Desulfobacterales bacterium]|nr:carboxypeptidase-like regulatory domain-containing protein [Desulfobacterales bacterium]